MRRWLADILPPRRLRLRLRLVAPRPLPLPHPRRPPRRGLLIIMAMAMAMAMAQAASGGQPLALESAIEARADEHVVATITFTNVSGDRIHEARIDAAVPAGFRYVQGSAQGPGAIVLFSIDGGLRFVPEGELTALRSANADVDDSDADDPDVDDQAPLTHVRWLLPGPFDPGARGQVRFLARPVDTRAP